MAGTNSPLTTHILDTANGTPAKNVPLTVFILNVDGTWHELTKRYTNSDGRCPGLLSVDQFTPGTYKITFDTKAYFASNNTKGFYPYVDVVLR
eukprot:UN17097